MNFCEYGDCWTSIKVEESAVLVPTNTLPCLLLPRYQVVPSRSLIYILLCFSLFSMFFVCLSPSAIHPLMMTKSRPTRLLMSGLLVVSCISSSLGTILSTRNRASHWQSIPIYFHHVGFGIPLCIVLFDDSIFQCESSLSQSLPI